MSYRTCATGVAAPGGGARACVYCTNVVKPSCRWYLMYRYSRRAATLPGVGGRKGGSSAVTSGDASGGALLRSIGRCTAPTQRAANC